MSERERESEREQRERGQQREGAAVFLKKTRKKEKMEKPEKKERKNLSPARAGPDQDEEVAVLHDRRAREVFLQADGVGRAAESFIPREIDTSGGGGQLGGVVQGKGRCRCCLGALPLPGRSGRGGGAHIVCVLDGGRDVAGDVLFLFLLCVSFPV